MLRHAVPLALLVATRPAAAERIAWTPLRLAGTIAIDVPTDSHFLLTDFRVDIAQQVGGAATTGNHGHGPFASLGGAFGLGLYNPIGGYQGCEDEIDPDDGSKRWTCGRLTLGGSVTVGWSSGSLLKSGYMTPERTIYLQLTPYVAAVKNPERSGLELDVTATLGYWWSWAGFGARWSRIPGNDYYGVSFTLTRGFSEWFAEDELVEPEIEKAKGPPPPMRLELGVGGGYPVRKDTPDTKPIGAIHLGVYRRSSETLDGPFTGIGGVLALPLGDSGGANIGPAVTIGQRSGDVGVYFRARGLIGGRTIADETQLDYGAEGAIGLSVGIPEAELEGEVGDSSFGFEGTVSWIAGDVFVGGNVQLLLF